MMLGVFRAELESNRRLVRLIWSGLYILAVYIVVGLYDENERLTILLDQVQSQVSRTVGINDQQRWRESLALEEQAQSVFLKRCWVAPSGGLAKADMQTLLQQLARTYEIGQVRLTLSSPIAHRIGNQAVWEVRAQMTGKATPSNMLNFVNSLDKPSAYFAVERLYFSEKRSGSLNLMLHGCFVEEAQ
jgi:hypothetical protein